MTDKGLRHDIEPKVPDRIRHNGVEFVSTREALKVLHCSKWKLQKLVASKALRVYKIPELRTPTIQRPPHYFRVDDLIPHIQEES